MNTTTEYRNGLLSTIFAFTIWGIFPLFWHLLATIPSLLVLAHRVLWSAVLVGGGLLLTRKWQWLVDIWRTPQRLLWLGVSGFIITGNWGLYIWAVAHGHIVESSLGYFINPLLSVILGVVFLAERMNPAQWLAVGLATIGVAWLTWQGGRFPWIAIALAISFALYGLIRKLVVVEAVIGLGVESLFMVIPALIGIIWAENGHGGGFIHGWSWGINSLLILSGLVTAVPLIAFAYGVRRLPLSTAGLLQYIGPTLQFLIGVLVLHEPFALSQLLGFGFIWAGLAIFAANGLRVATQSR